MLLPVRKQVSAKRHPQHHAGYFGGLYASNFNSFGKMYRVMIQAEPNATKNLESLSSIKVRNGNEMAPITQFISSRRYTVRISSAVSTFTHP